VQTPSQCFEGRAQINTEFAPILQQSHTPQTTESEGQDSITLSLKDYSYVYLTQPHLWIDGHSLCGNMALHAHARGQTGQVRKHCCTYHSRNCCYYVRIILYVIIVEETLRTRVRKNADFSMGGMWVIPTPPTYHSVNR
jgi:hypothetical protein